MNSPWKRENMVDLAPDCACDFHLVMTGPHSTMVCTVGATRPWVITAVYLFDTQQLLAERWGRGVRLGVASSVAEGQWKAAEIYPNANNRALVLSEEQRALLALFGRIDP